MNNDHEAETADQILAAESEVVRLRAELAAVDAALRGETVPNPSERVKAIAGLADAARLDDLASFGDHVFPGFTGAPTPDNVSEIAAYLEGYVYRLRHGAAPAVEFNGDTPYAKAIPVEGGQNCRVSWERGWKAAHDAAGPRRAKRGAGREDHRQQLDPRRA